MSANPIDELRECIESEEAISREATKRKRAALGQFLICWFGGSIFCWFVWDWRWGGIYFLTMGAFSNLAIAIINGAKE